MKKFEIEAQGMRSNDTSYTGGFSLTVRNIIKPLLTGDVLHLFSGGSLIGGVRVDKTSPNATQNVTVDDFISSDERCWDFVILDPPYKLANTGTSAPHYDMPIAVSQDVLFRRKLENYLRRHTKNVIWLDICAPLPKGFRRRKVWFLFPGGYRPLRVLSWLEKEMDLLL